MGALLQVEADWSVFGGFVLAGERRRRETGRMLSVHASSALSACVFYPTIYVF